MSKPGISYLRDAAGALCLPTDEWLSGQVGVLGSMLIDDTVAGTVLYRLDESHFSGPWKTIFRVCRDVFRENKPIDAMVVYGRLGPDYHQTILDVMDVTPTAANVEAYIDLTLEQATLRRLRDMGTKLSGIMDMEEGRTILGQANRILGGKPGVRIMNMEQGLLDFHDRQTQPARRLTWGLPKVDATLKAEPGDFIILGGYPSAGKTALSLKFAWEQAKDKRVGYFSLETKPEKLIDRAVATVCGVDFGRIKDHKMTTEDWYGVERWQASFVGRKLEIIQAGGLSVVDIQALTLAQRYEIIYIDYLQLVAPEDRRRSTVEQVTQISMDLHTLAQTTGITVCALSQLSRPEKSGEQEKAPGLHSLRQSGQIEQDADGVLLLYKENPNDTRSRRCLKIAKNKEGEAGGVLKLNFDGALQRFSEFMDTTPAEKPKPQYQQQTFEDLPGDGEDLPPGW